MKNQSAIFKGISKSIVSLQGDKFLLLVYKRIKGKEFRFEKGEYMPIWVLRNYE